MRASKPGLTKESFRLALSKEIAMPLVALSRITRLCPCC
jgi:hypothetical protein